MEVTRPRKSDLHIGKWIIGCQLQISPISFDHSFQPIIHYLFASLDSSPHWSMHPCNNPSITDTGSNLCTSLVIWLVDPKMEVSYCLNTLEKGIFMASWVSFFIVWIFVSSWHGNGSSHYIQHTWNRSVLCCLFPLGLELDLDYPGNPFTMFTKTR